MQNTNIDKRRKEKHRVTILAAALAVCGYYETHINKLPRRVSSLRGATYVKEILSDHPMRCREICRMELPIFKKLSKILRSKGLVHDTAGIEVEEQLIMFLFIIGSNASNRQVQERFQHSGETISRHFNNVLNAITGISSTYIHLPSQQMSSSILNQQSFSQYFKDCIGVIGNAHIPLSIEVDKQAPFRNVKGILTQNVMAACSFDLRFHFVLAGNEGSITDSVVLQKALHSGFMVPEGKYYLVDTGHSSSSNFIAPYQGVPYHQKEFKLGHWAPQNVWEFFNLRHSLLRDSIDRAFGVLKKRFPILNVAPCYPYETQVKLVIASCTLHNLILIETGGDDWLCKEYDMEIESQKAEVDDLLTNHMPYDITCEAQWQDNSILRDSIANALWEDYCNN